MLHVTYLDSTNIVMEGLLLSNASPNKTLFSINQSRMRSYKSGEDSYMLNVKCFNACILCRMLDHPNLCKFVGAVVRDPVIVAVISEYCPKGSLNDVLQNDDIPLNWGFRLSFAYDIAQAMAYLHSKKNYHGHLKSSNCVIDDRWVVKITGTYCYRGISCVHLCTCVVCRLWSKLNQNVGM